MWSVQPVPIGAGNPRLRRLRRLIARTKARSQERAFVVDGPLLVAEALRSELAVEQIFAARSVLADPELAALVCRSGAAGTEVYEVDESVLGAVLDPVNPRPLAAVVAQPSWVLDDLDADQPVLVAVELRDPGNLGTAIRSAEAAGFGGVVVVGESVDSFAPKVVRASAGSVLRLPIVRLPELDQALAAISARGWPVLCAVVDPEAPRYDSIDLSGAAILVGNEPHGLPPRAIRLGDGTFTIPLSDTVESLNVAAAASVLCFEAARQRRVLATDGPKSVGQPEDEQTS